MAHGTAMLLTYILCPRFARYANRSPTSCSLLCSWGAVQVVVQSRCWWWRRGPTEVLAT